MAYHNSCAFSTFDQDNDKNERLNCAREYHGGWWFNSCHEVHLNGNLKYNGSYAQGISWKYLTDYKYSLRSSRMMITLSADNTS